MLIFPNTTINILKGVPLGSDYENTLHFESFTEQYNYFTSKIEYTLDEQMYQRYKTGTDDKRPETIRVDLTLAQLSKCNYLMYRNSSFEGKWIYAFIKQVNYLNNSVSEIEYEIDVLQTYCLDYYLGETFIERHHVDDDTIGRNTVSESLTSNEYVLSRNQTASFGSGTFQDLCVIIMSTLNKDFEDTVEVKKQNGMIGGVNFIPFLINDLDGVQNYINTVTSMGAGDQAILGIYLAPIHFTKDYGKPTSQITKNELDISSTPISYQFSVPKVNKTNNPWINWTPKNNKLYTYPYNMLCIQSTTGGVAEYKYEMFSSNNCEFNTTGTVAYPPQVILRPYNYSMDATEEGHINYFESLTLQGYPIVPYATDSFQAWLSQTALPNTESNAMKVIGNGILGAMIPAVAPAMLISSASTILSSVSELVTGGLKSTREAPRQEGDIQSNLAVSMGLLTYLFQNKHVKLEQAKIIDEYFTRFGYKRNRTYAPSRMTRKEFTYLKTVGADVKGNIPNEEKEKINKIYDKGITFWKNPENFGKYSVDNPPVKG